jgi:hypothetical protein
MGAIISWIVEMLGSASSATLAAIGTRIGMVTPTVESITAAVKANPITAALVASELGMAVEKVIGYMSGGDVPPGQLEHVKMLLQHDDAPPGKDISITDVGKYADEMAAIKEAVGAFGTLDKLLTIRRVFKMDDRMFDLYVTLRDMRY